MLVLYSDVLDIVLSFNGTLEACRVAAVNTDFARSVAVFTGRLTNPEISDWKIALSEDSYNKTLYIACRAGYIEIGRWAKEKGAADWHEARAGAFEGGHQVIKDWVFANTPCCCHHNSLRDDTLLDTLVTRFGGNVAIGVSATSSETCEDPPDLATGDSWCRGNCFSNAAISSESEARRCGDGPLEYVCSIGYCYAQNGAAGPDLLYGRCRACCENWHSYGNSKYESRNT